MSKKIIIAGGQNIGVNIVEFLQKTEHEVVGIIARTDDIGEDSIFPSLLKKAFELNIPVIRPQNVNAPEVLTFVKNVEAECLISAMYNQIFKKDILEIFFDKLGAINIHYAPLPLYCGFWPEMRAIWNDEENFAITFHYINTGVDSGDILYQPKVNVTENETRQSLYEKCDDVAIQTFKANYQDFLTQKKIAISQNMNNKSYYKRELPHNGFIDLSWDKEKIERFIRATSFYPFVGAKLKIGNKIYSIVDKDLEFFKPHKIGDK